MFVAYEEIERTASIAEVLGHAGPVEDLVVAGIFAEVRPVYDLALDFQLLELPGDAQIVAGERLEKLVADFRNIEITHDDEIVILNELVIEARIDPVSQQLQFLLPANDAVAPAG